MLSASMENFLCNIGSLAGGIHCESCCNSIHHHPDEKPETSSSKNITITQCNPPRKLVFPTRTTCCRILDHETPNVHGLYKFGRELGRGCSGITYSCTEIDTGIEYACKSIPKRNLKSMEDVEDVRREIKVMQYLCGEKNIVKLKGVYEDVLCVYTVMELCLGGELFDLIKEKGYFCEREAAKLIKVVVGVVETCHSLGVMHRDLKPENFVLLKKDKDEEDGSYSLKAIDFGVSAFFKPGQIFTERVGSPYYIAPEVIKQHYGPEADIWSCGVILYILLCGVPPFWAETARAQLGEILKGNINFESEPWPQVSDSAKDLIRKMLCLRPSERLTAGQVLNEIKGTFASYVNFA